MNTMLVQSITQFIVCLLKGSFPEEEIRLFNPNKRRANTHVEYRVYPACRLISFMPDTWLARNFRYPIETAEQFREIMSWLLSHYFNTDFVILDYEDLLNNDTPPWVINTLGELVAIEI
jgi:hypothetical protein